MTAKPCIASEGHGVGFEGAQGGATVDPYGVVALALSCRAGPDRNHSSLAMDAGSGRDLANPDFK